MIGVTSWGCDADLTGEDTDRAGQGHLMAAHPMGPGSAIPPPEWHSSAHGQLMACLRAGVIALVLLGVLALIVLY
jgi:hypothetical protein